MKRLFVVLLISMGVLLQDAHLYARRKHAATKELAIYADAASSLVETTSTPSPRTSDIQKQDMPMQVGSSESMDVDSVPVIEQKEVIEPKAAPMKMDILEDESMGEQEAEDLLPEAASVSNKPERTLVVTESNAPASEQEYDPEKKKKMIESFIKECIEFFNKNSFDQALAALSHDKKFKRGELYIFVYDMTGTCLAHGQDIGFIWQNMYNVKDSYGVPFVQEFIKKAQQGGGWTTYQWRGSTKLSFIQMVKKNGKNYVMGCGYYPQSKVDVVVNLVKGAVALFNEVVKSKRTVDEAFSTFNYPLGRFVFGDLYLYALDFTGIQVAHGELPGIVGTNAWTYRDAQGKLVNQEIIAKLKEVGPGQGVWIDYISKNAPKRTYAEKVVDGNGKYYFIACGYYPDATSKQAVNLVERGYQYMKANGKAQAARAFTDKAEMAYRYGDLFLFVYDMKGLCIAHGGNPSLVGTNMYNEKDEDGSYYIQEFIQKAKKSDYGWVDYREKNAFKTAYVEKIDIGESYVIGCSVQPLNKRETMLMLAKSGGDFFKSAPVFEDAVREFVKVDGKFIRGDMAVFVMDGQAVCLADGDDKSFIWKSLMNAKDDNGKEYIKLLINTVKQNRGPATISYRLNGATYIQYVAPIIKDGKEFLVGSGFYL